MALWRKLFTLVNWEFSLLTRMRRYFLQRFNMSIKVYRFILIVLCFFLSDTFILTFIRYCLTNFGPRSYMSWARLRFWLLKSRRFIAFNFIDWLRLYRILLLCREYLLRITQDIWLQLALLSKETISKIDTDCFFFIYLFISYSYSLRVWYVGMN